MSQPVKKSPPAQQGQVAIKPIGDPQYGTVEVTIWDEGMHLIGTAEIQRTSLVRAIYAHDHRPQRATVIDWSGWRQS